MHKKEQQKAVYKRKNTVYIYTVYLNKVPHMQALTNRQAQILDFIKRTLRDTGFPPTRKEIASEFGFSSANSAEEHLKALARKGAIEMSAGASRGIKVIETENSGLPIIGKVAAGAPILAIEHIHNYCEIPNEFFKPSADYLLEVAGDSMQEVGILDGDLIAVHKTQQAQKGQIIVARVNDEVTVKRFEKQKDKIILHPENQDYSPIIVQLGIDEFNIEGLYVGVIRKH